MRFTQSFLTVSVLTAALTVILFIIHPHHTEPVMRNITGEITNHTKRLNNSNLVDWLVGLSLETRLMRVDWHSPTLSLDMVISSDTPLDAENVQSFLRDAEQIWRMCFLRTDNVDRVLIRFGESPNAKPYSGLFARSDRAPVFRLLLAADVRRSDRWIEAGESAWSGIEYADTDPIWRQRLRLSFTPLWESKRN
ncbi:hypothetical protein [Paenibacillus xylaniclasticus]|uniref:hypothetical protein n=1 Tax=Paenibacillus xylaniclasticus TaxID=588083 RepID=UPI000FDB208B|nr:MULTISPECIES: hypothetical protein [Paenibacillus]